MFKTLKNYHFYKLPQKVEKKAECMLKDLCPLGILNEGTIDAVEVWGKEDILTLMRAMYFEAKHEIFSETQSNMKIEQINGFRIGDNVRLKDGDGRPHIIKSFELDGFHDFFIVVHFEDGTEAMPHEIALLQPQGLDEAAGGYYE